LGLARDIWVRVEHLMDHPIPIDREAYVRALIGSRRILQQALCDLNDTYRDNVLLPEIAHLDLEKEERNCTSTDAATKAITFYILARFHS